MSTLQERHPHPFPNSFNPNCPSCQNKIPRSTTCRYFNCDNLVLPKSRDCPGHQEPSPQPHQAADQRLFPVRKQLANPYIGDI